MVKKILNLRYILSILIIYSFISTSTAMTKYSYCSNGYCKTMTNEYFHQKRGMPLDLSAVCKKNNQYALTFDDGPSANYEELLKILDKHKIKATFFVNGQNINNNNTEMLKKVYQAGHSISNHTLNHKDLTADDISDEEILNQIQNNKDSIVEKVGLSGFNHTLEISTKVVRPPYGNIDKRVDNIFKANHYTAVRWNGDRYDWNLNDDSDEIIYNRIIQQLDFIDNNYKAGLIDTNSIMDLNHDFRKATLKAIDRAIPVIKQRGYEFVDIIECLQLS